mgnify:CR=1 FL=1
MLLGYLAWPVLVGISIAAYFIFDGQSAYVYEWGMLAMTVLFCALLLLTADDRFFIGAALESPRMRWLGWLGKRSFGIYLWQYPVIYLFAKLGWTQLPYYAALEIAAILVLTVWSDALANVITSRRLPAINGRHVVTACIFLTVFTLPGLAMMGFGGHAIAVSADQKVSDTGELQEKLAANAAAQQAANDQAAAGAAGQSENAAAPADVDLSGVACIGDSVMLGSSGELRKVLPGCIIDAEVSRYVGGGLDAAKQMDAQAVSARTSSSRSARTARLPATRSTRSRRAPCSSTSDPTATSSGSTSTVRSSRGSRRTTTTLRTWSRTIRM